MKEIPVEPTEIECVHCGKKGYYTILTVESKEEGLK